MKKHTLNILNIISFLIDLSSTRQVILSNLKNKKKYLLVELELAILKKNKHILFRKNLLDLESSL
jgi:hypothetical protein